MKLIYFKNYDTNQKSGVGKKVICQSANLIDLGVDLELISVEGKDSTYKSQPFIKHEKISEIDSASIWSIFPKIIRQYKISKLFENILENSDNQVVVYLRYPFPLFFCPWRFNKIKKCLVITEHNTIESEEYKLRSNYLGFFLDSLIGGMIRKNLDGIVGVTEEITDYQLARIGNKFKPHISIGNGIDVESVKVRNPAGFINKELRLLCVANFSRWHGIDKLIKGLSLYKGDVQIELNLVGEGEELERLKELTKYYRLEHAVKFHGYLSGKMLDDLFDKCHIAVGTLGIHRKGLRMTSELKIREYAARGIPFITCSQDPDFPGDFPYMMKLPADEAAINLDTVVIFAKGVYNDPTHHIKMREFSIENLDWSVKMRQLKDFCELISVGKQS